MMLSPSSYVGMLAVMKGFTGRAKTSCTLRLCPEPHLQPPPVFIMLRLGHGPGYWQHVTQHPQVGPHLCSSISCEPP
jgi:hypothetical protein